MALTGLSMRASHVPYFSEVIISNMKLNTDLTKEKKMS